MKTLREIYQQHHGKISDKWALYLNEYERLFSACREKEISLLEIGVQHGGSLEIWSRYFPKAECLVGCDIDPQCSQLRYEDPRISIVVGDANTDACEASIAKQAEAYDIIIDDGSHRSGDVIRSFVRLFGRLKADGIYIVEDLHCSYWKGYEGGLYYPYSAMAFFKRLADVLNHEHWGVENNRADLLSGFARRFSLEINESVLAEIHAVEFLDSLCVIKKSAPSTNVLGRRIVAGIRDDEMALRYSDDLPDASAQTTNPWSVREAAPEQSWEELVTAFAEHNLQLKRKDAEIAALRQAREKQAAECRALEMEMRNQQEQMSRQREEFQRLLGNAQAFHCCLDSPARQYALTGWVTFAGWIFHETEEIVELQLVAGEHTVDARCAMERPDVRERYGSYPNSLCSGFQAEAVLPPGRYRIQFKARTSGGFTLTYDPGICIKVGRSSAFGYLQTRVAAFCSLATRASILAFTYISHNRRLPPLRAAFSALQTLLRQQAAPSSSDRRGMNRLTAADHYEAWVRVNTFTQRDRLLLEQQIRALKNKPLFSVVMPVYNPTLAFLRTALQSLDDQVYDHWELCVALDGPQGAETEAFLSDYCGKQPHAKLVRRQEHGGISACSNAAAEAADGNWLLFLDQDDLLTPDALAEFALLIGSDPNLGVVYSDGDKINSSGQRYDPEFKPDFSPELLLSYMYFGHALAVRKDLFDSAGMLRSEYDGSQDYDLALRLVETGAAIGHIPRILYHWRAHKASTAVSGKAKPGSIEAGRRAVEDVFRRRGQKDVNVIQPDWANASALGIYEPVFPDSGPAVTIIIPTRNGIRNMRRCINSLARTTYVNRRVLIVDDASDDPDTVDYLQSLPSDKFTVLTRHRGSGTFNFSAIVNEAVARCDTEHILLLNDDTEVVEPRWLSQMMGYARMPGVGVVGAKLLFPDKRIQHAGVLLGMNAGLAEHAFKLVPGSCNGYLSYACVARNYSAVTAACMLTRKSILTDTGGFDAKHLAVAYNDVDYCMRAGVMGYRSVYVPGATLIHHEGATRGRGLVDSTREEAFFRQRLRRHGPDRYYNPNLSLKEPFRISSRKLARSESEPFKLLAATPWLNFTGAPLQQYAVVRELTAQTSISAQVLCPFDGPLRAGYEACGIGVESSGHPLQRCGTRSEFDAIATRMGEDFQNKGVQVVFATTLDAFFYVMAAHKAGIPSIWSIHESVDWETYFAHLPKELRRAVGECFGLPYRLVFVSKATADMYRHVAASHSMEVIHNGIDPRIIRKWRQSGSRNQARNHLQIRPDEMVILSVGTVCERKGQIDLVKAFGRLDSDTATRSRCFIVGDRPGIYSDKLHQCVSTLAPERRCKIHVVSETDEVAPYYRAADLFVCTSRVESYPLTILEAMHMGLPVISTPVFGIQEQVRDGVNGMFYKPGQVDDLADAIMRLAGDSGTRARMAESGKHMLRRMNTFRDMVTQYRTLLTEAAMLGRR